MSVLRFMIMNLGTEIWPYSRFSYILLVPCWSQIPAGAVKTFCSQLLFKLVMFIISQRKIVHHKYIDYRLVTGPHT